MLGLVAREGDPAAGVAPADVYGNRKRKALMGTAGDVHFSFDIAGASSLRNCFRWLRMAATVPPPLASQPGDAIELGGNTLPPPASIWRRGALLFESVPAGERLINAGGDLLVNYRRDGFSIEGLGVAMGGGDVEPGDPEFTITMHRLTSGGAGGDWPR